MKLFSLLFVFSKHSFGFGRLIIHRKIRRQNKQKKKFTSFGFIYFLSSPHFTPPRFLSSDAALLKCTPFSLAAKPLRGGS